MPEVTQQSQEADRMQIWIRLKGFVPPSPPPPQFYSCYLLFSLNTCDLGQSARISPDKTHCTGTVCDAHCCPPSA